MFAARRAGLRWALRSAGAARAPSALPAVTAMQPAWLSLAACPYSAGAPEPPPSVRAPKARDGLIPENHKETYSSDRISIGMRGDGTSPRFYKEVTVREHKEEGMFEVLLDGRTLKTPGRKPLMLPNKALAMAVAAEWEWQLGREIRPFTMPLMTLAATSIDRVPLRQDIIISDLLRFFHTDAACCRAEAGSGLGKKQAELLDPLVEFVSELLGTRVKTSDALLGAEQTPDATSQLERHLRSLSHYELAALDSLSGVGKSTVIALSALHGKISLDDTVEAVRLEEHFQIEEWGMVEGGHDIDLADVRVRVHAPVVFMQLVRYRGDT